MRKEFLERAVDFTDMEVKTKPTDGYPAPPDELWLCPVCHGYGGWNLALNAYGEGKHFRASCFQCRGWGWVDETDRDCIHDNAEISPDEARAEGVPHFGMYYHVVKCRNCGHVQAYDSSG